MKIAMVIERMDLRRGGRETSTAQVAAALAARGHDVTILCQNGTWSCDGVRVLALGRRGMLRSRRLRHFVQDVQQAIRRERYDVVHATLPVPGANVYQPRGGTLEGRRAAACRRRGVLGSLLAEAASPLNLARREMARLEQQVLADRGVLCLAVSDMVAREFQEHYGRSEKVRVVFNAVDVPPVDDERRADWRQRLRYKLGVGPDDPVFITVAANFPLKGVDWAIAAFAKWHHARYGRRNGRLLVVGRDVVENYQRHASLRDVGHRVVFLPPTENTFEYYAGADACILLSWYDPCSRVVLEATRWGIPSVTTRFNGASEALTGGAGFVVASPKDAAGIVAAMEALTDPQTRAACVQACHAAAARLGIDRHVDELLAAYAEVTPP